jgi:hypothetical protein
MHRTLTAISIGGRQVARFLDQLIQQRGKLSMPPLQAMIRGRIVASARSSRSSKTSLMWVLAMWHWRMFVGAGRVAR